MSKRVVAFVLLAFLGSALAGVWVADNTQPLPTHVGDSISKPVVDVQNAVEQVAKAVAKQ